MTSRLLASLLALVAISTTLAACSSDEPAAAPEAVTGEEEDVTGTKTRYVDIQSRFTADADYEAWSTLRTKLVNDFDNVCGDTFCGGDFSDLTPVQLSCSATEKTGKVRECLWTFGGSYAAVDGKTGAIQSVATTFPCKFQVSASSKDFLALSAKAEPLREPLPGRTESIYDALVGCFTSKAPLPLGTDGAYISVNDGGTEDESSRYFAMRRKLNKAFDQVCGDTFCEGDYSDIYGLSLSCSVDPATHKVGACVWPFAGASSSVAQSTGNVSAQRKTWSCALPVTGTLGDLLTALEGKEDPLEAVLPGSDKTVYDAVADCLLASRSAFRSRSASLSRARAIAAPVRDHPRGSAPRPRRHRPERPGGAAWPLLDLPRRGQGEGEPSPECPRTPPAPHPSAQSPFTLPAEKAPPACRSGSGNQGTRVAIVNPLSNRGRVPPFFLQVASGP